MASALYGSSGRVLMVTLPMKASVPSDPASRWATISKGSENLTNGSRFRPVTFLMEYLYFILSTRDSSSNIRARIRRTASRMSGRVLRKLSREASSSVSRTVPSAKTIRAPTISMSELAWVPQLIPEALFITIPPTMQLPMDAGSGPNLRP